MASRKSALAAAKRIHSLLGSGGEASSVGASSVGASSIEASVGASGDGTGVGEEEASADEESDNAGEGRAKRTRQVRGARRGPTAYRKLSDFTRVAPGIHTLEEWRVLARSARPVKRTSRPLRITDGESFQGAGRFARPPIDLLVLALPSKAEALQSCGAGAPPRLRLCDTLLESSVAGPCPTTGRAVIEYSADGRAKDRLELPAVGYTAMTTDGLLLAAYCGPFGVASISWSVPLLAAGSGAGADGGGAEDNGRATEQFLAVALQSGPVAALLPQRKEDRQGDLQIWSVSGRRECTAALRRIVRVASSGGGARHVVWSPHSQCREDGTATHHLALISDAGLGVVLALEGLEGCQQHGRGKEEVCVEVHAGVRIGSTALTSLAWSPVDGAVLCTGSAEGTIQLWRLAGGYAVAGSSVCGEALLVATVQGPSRRPVTSIAFHQGTVVAVGFHDSPAIIVDLAAPPCAPSSGAIAQLSSSFANVPIVRCSPMHGGAFIYGDSEQYVRATLPEDVLERRSFPLATLASAASDVAVSPLHNIVAVASAEGALHLSWPNVEKRCLAVEKRILRLECCRAPKGPIVTIRHVEEPAISTKQAALYGAERAISALQWSRSPASPGLLAFAVAASGILFIATVDGLTLLQ